MDKTKEQSKETSVKNILEAIEGLNIKPTPSAVACGRAFFKTLNEYFEPERASKKPVLLESFFGIKVYVDKGLKPNEWKFVYREEDI